MQIAGTIEVVGDPDSACDVHLYCGDGVVTPFSNEECDDRLLSSFKTPFTYARFTPSVVFPARVRTLVLSPLAYKPQLVPKFGDCRRQCFIFIAFLSWLRV